MEKPAELDRALKLYDITEAELPEFLQITKEELMNAVNIDRLIDDRAMAIRNKDRRIEELKIAKMKQFEKLKSDFMEKHPNKVIVNKDTYERYKDHYENTVYNSSPFNLINCAIGFVSFFVIRSILEK